MPPIPPDREAARRGGQKSAQIRKEQARLKADARARLRFENATEKMAELLIEAALGEGVFSRLDPKDRANFAVKVLEYGMGRPRQADRAEEPKPIDAGGIAFAPGGLTESDAVAPRGP